MDRYQCLKLFYSHGGCPFPPPHHRGCQQRPPSQGASNAPCDTPPPSDAKVSFFDNLVKNLTVARDFRNNIWFSIPIPKIKFEPPPQGKNVWCSHFGVHIFIKSAIFFWNGKFHYKIEFS